MKISRIVNIILLITCCSVFYVWQQTQIVKLSYKKQEKLKLCHQLLDRNMLLRYNLLSLASSENLTKNLQSFDDSYEIPHFSQVVDLRDRDARSKLELTSLSRGQAQEYEKKNRQNIFLSLFSPKSQAEAQTK
jgi:hypothetical protein